MADSIKDKLEETGHKIAETATKVGHRVGEKVEEAADWVKEKSHQVGNRLDETAQKVEHKVKETFGETGPAGTLAAALETARAHVEVVTRLGGLAAARDVAALVEEHGGAGAVREALAGLAALAGVCG